MTENDIINIVLTSTQFENSMNFFLDNLKKFKDEQDKKINAIQADLENNIEYSNKVSNDNKKLNEKIGELNSLNSKMANEKLALEYDIENKKRDIAALEDKVSQLTEQINKVSNDNSKLKQQITVLNTRNEKIATEKVRLENELKTKNSDIKALEDKLSHSANLNDELQNKNREHEEKIKSDAEEFDMKSKKKDKEIKQLKEDKSSIEDELDNTKKQLKSANEKNDDFERKFNIFINAGDIFDTFDNLSNETKKRLASIFESDTFEGFIANGLQFENISVVWDFIKRKIIDNDNTDVEKLLKIFDFFFKFYNLGAKETRYELIEPKIGDSFDRNLCSILGTEIDGTISQVLLPGYKDVKTGDVKKSVVSVK